MGNEGSSTARVPKPPICGQFCCSDFYLFDDEESLSTNGDELTSPIHPIFAQIHWDNTSYADYNSLRMTLRLASNLMRTDAFAEFVATALHGDLYVDVDPNAHKSSKFVKPRKFPAISGQNVALDRTGHTKIFPIGYFETRYYKTDIPSLRRGIGVTNETPQHFLDRSALLRMPKRGWKTANQLMRLRVQSILGDMKGLFSFRRVKMSKVDVGVNGRCHELPGPLGEHHDRLFPFGRRSRNVLNAQNVQDIKDAQQEFEQGKIDEVRLRIRELNVAITIVHEIGHAINALANGHSIGKRVGFRDNACIETGYDLTAHIFGGVLRESKRRLPTPTGPHIAKEEEELKTYLVMHDWPSGLTFAGYTANNGSIAKRGDLPATETLTRVPHSFAMKLFTNQFWTNQALTNRRGDLRPKGPRWTASLKTRTSRRYQLASLIDELPSGEVTKLMRIVARQSTVKRALEDLTDDLFIMSTAADRWPEDDKEPKLVSDAPFRRSSSILKRGEEQPSSETRRRLPAKRIAALMEATSVAVGAKRRRTA